MCGSFRCHPTTYRVLFEWRCGMRAFSCKGGAVRPDPIGSNFLSLEIQDIDKMYLGTLFSVLSKPVSETFRFRAWESLVVSSPTRVSLLDGNGSPRWCSPAFGRLFDLSENITWNLHDPVEEDEAGHGPLTFELSRWSRSRWTP